MSARLVPIHRATRTADPKAHEKKLRREFLDAWRQLDHRPYGYQDYPEYLERRLRTLERALRGLLACDGVTDVDRAKVLAVMYGAPASTMDSRLLNDTESRLIQCYRATDAAGRQILRALSERLAYGPHREEAAEDEVIRTSS
jgi:hypothetical protein